MKSKPNKVMCPICRLEFDYISNRPNQRFCSIACGNVGKRYRPQPYTVETLCKCGCKKIIMNPDDHYRYRKFVKGHVNSRGTHPRLGYKEDEAHIELRMKSVRKHFRNKEPTCIEKELYKYLESKNVDYIKQKQIGRYIPDAFIPSLNLCIFADGLYWHTRPETIERDKRANEILIQKGYEVIRLPSKDNGYHLDLTNLYDITS